METAGTGQLPVPAVSCSQLVWLGTAILSKGRADMKKFSNAPADVERQVVDGYVKA